MGVVAVTTIGCALPVGRRRLMAWVDEKFTMAEIEARISVKRTADPLRSAWEAPRMISVVAEFAKWANLQREVEDRIVDGSVLFTGTCPLCGIVSLPYGTRCDACEEKLAAAGGCGCCERCEHNGDDCEHCGL
jgi:hypothetical protein